jgi:hypothetical protein
MAFNVLGVDPPYYTRSETNALLLNKADSLPTNSSFTVIVNNTTSSLSYLQSQISGLSTTKAGRTETNNTFTTVITNVNSSTTYLQSQISQISPLINTEVQLDSSIYTNINSTDGIQLLKQK